MRSGTSLLERVLATAAALVVSLSIVGCDAANDPPQSPSQLPSSAHANGKPTWSELLDATLNDASLDVSADAREILRPSLDTGEVTRLQVTQAAELSRTCVEDAGMELSLTVPEADFVGYEAEVRLRTGTERDDAKAERLGLIAQHCLDTNLYAVETLYLLQPTAVEQNDAAAEQRFEEYRDVLVGCLVRAGFPIDADAPMTEVREALAQETTVNGSAACMFSTGYAG